MHGTTLRLEKPPYGIRHPDGRWSLIRQETIDKQEIADYLIQNDSPRMSPPEIVSPPVIAYIKKRHPDFKIQDLAPVKNYLLHACILGAGINREIWAGGTPGSVQLVRAEALRRTLCEVLERTALVEADIPLDTLASSAISIDRQVAEEYSLFEALERMITLDAYLQKPGYAFRNFPLDEGALPFQRIAVEWKPYGAKIFYFIIDNPWHIPVGLARISVEHQGKNWIFYGNGIGVTPEAAYEKALMESLQFIPGPHEGFWTHLGDNGNQHTERFRQWTENPLVIRPDGMYQGPPENVLAVCYQAIKEYKGEMKTQQIPELPYVHLSTVSAPGEPWNSYRGVPLV